MAEILVFDNFEMTIIRSARRKTAAIKVDLDGASVRVPQDLSASRIRELVAEKSHWIEQKLAVAEQKRRDLALQNQRNAALGKFRFLVGGSMALMQRSREFAPYQARAGSNARMHARTNE